MAFNDVNIKKKHYAISKKNMECREKLIKYGKSLSVRDRERRD